MTTPTEKDAMALATLAACEAYIDTTDSFHDRPGEGSPVAEHRKARAHLASRIAELEQSVRLITEDRECYAAMLARAEAELAAVREDGARLDWLESNKADVFQTMHSNEFAVQVCDDLDVKAKGYAPTLRAAIDAARGGE